MMNKHNLYRMSIIFCLSATLVACNAPKTDTSPLGPGESKSASNTVTSDSLGDTFWQAKLNDENGNVYRTIDLFFFADGSFHARDQREYYYTRAPYYFHLESDVSTWRQDGEDLELEFLTHTPSKKVIFNAKYRNGEITMDDFLEQTSVTLHFSKQETMPRLPNREEDAPKLSGDWIEVLWEDEGKTFMVEDIYTPSTMQITKQGGDLFADFNFNWTFEEGETVLDDSFSNAKIELKDGEMYSGVLNEFWYGELVGGTQPHPATTQKLTLLDDDTLLLEQLWFPSDHDDTLLDSTPTPAMDAVSAQETNAPKASMEEGSTDAQNQEVDINTSQNDTTASGDTDAAYTDDTEYGPYDVYRYSTRIFLRKDSQAYTERENLRYRKTVTVSTVEELERELRGNTRILLKAGTYNVTPVSDSSMYEGYFGKFHLTGMDNLSIEAMDGEEVHIVMEDPVLPVISLTYSSHVKLKGLTLGHDIEKGECAGSVVYLSEADYVDIIDCNLYGCGTYGVEAESSDHLRVTGTEIYDCTYGLLSLTTCNHVLVKDSILRDSKEFVQIFVDDCRNVLFENSKIFNNFAQMQLILQNAHADDVDSKDLIFRSCEFKNNTFQTLFEGLMEFEDCTFDEHIG